tara:strand:- start:3088 stop:3333 length:246 start_codon:yes stop_codon:yes gene_type:complete
MPFDKLYLKVVCSICKGTRMFNHGHHDPHRPHRWKTCPYCDSNGLTVIEATADAIIKFIENTDVSARQRLKQKLAEIESEE